MSLPKIITTAWLLSIKALRPKHWKSSAVDDMFGVLSAMFLESKGAPLDKEDCEAIEKELLKAAYDLDSKVGDVDAIESRYLTEPVDITDSSSPWFASMRRPCHPKHTLSQAHIDAAKIRTEQFNLIKNERRFLAVQEHRLTLPIKADKGRTRSSYFTARDAAHLASISGAVVIPIGNFDYRPRVYPKLGNSGIQGGPGYRHIWDSPDYAFDSMVRFLFEEKILSRQFQLTPDKAKELARKSDAELIACHGEDVWSAIRAYENSLKTGICNYWAEIDLMGSGPTNVSCAIKDQALFRRISDISHDEWMHVRMIWAEHLRENYESLKALDDACMHKLLKLVLSPLQYGAGVPGTYHGLTGQKYDEDIEVDWKLFSEVNVILKGLFPTDDPNEFAEELYEFAKVLHQDFGKCFSKIKGLMDSVTKAYKECLEAGQVPTYTSYSGQVNYGPVVKRSKTKTHWAETTVTNRFGKDVPFKAKVSDKVPNAQKVAGCAFSWFFHGVDSEIITLFTILAHEQGIMHHTNHDAIFIRLCDWHMAQQLMAHCIITVGAYRIFEESGWDCVEYAGSVDCHWETETPEPLV